MKKLLKSLYDSLNASQSKSTQWKAFVTTAHEYLSKRQKSLIKEYKIGEYERFDWDQENGTLVFSNNDKPVVIAKVQFVGSLSNQTKTWLWSWANGVFLENVKNRMDLVKEYGEEHRYKELTKAKWYANEAEGWDMTSITAYLLKAKGAYRTSAENGYTYMVITDIHWAKDGK